MNKPAISKLFKLKEWLTLPDAAKHLSAVCNEEITEADILRLALDWHLRLSVYLVNNIYAKKTYLEAFDPDKVYTTSVRPYDDSDFFINFEDEVVLIKDVWDLAMVGNERIDIENKWNTLVNGLDVDRRGSDDVRMGGKNFVGALVFRDDTLCQLQINKADSMARCDKRNELILNCDSYGNFYPASGLPKNIVLVVRSESLREFESLIVSNETEKSAMTYTTPSKAELLHDKSTQLRALNQASLLWINADRDDKTTWPETSAVVSFLINKGFSKTLADRGASIVRPDWAESGARPKE